MTDPGKPAGEEGAEAVAAAAEGDVEELAGAAVVGEGADPGDPREGTSCYGDAYGYHVVTFMFSIVFYLFRGFH